jgi:predicted anti-sigma-YlaC factor YlaD
MKVRIIVGAQAAYACITHDRGTMDVRLSPGCSAHRSLFEYAGELRQKAAEQIERAALIEQAALECQAQMAAQYGTAA